jgi:pantetheine-phosphate adenylyltransferase
MTKAKTPSKVAIYPGTFDPLTLGHEDIIRRAAQLFDHVILGVAESLGKKPIFARDERMEVAREALADLNNVSVVGFSGLLVEFAKFHHAKVVVRGVHQYVSGTLVREIARMNGDIENFVAASVAKRMRAKLA